MNKVKTLVLMQLKDKINLQWLNSKKEKLRAIILSIVKFLIVTLFYTGVLYILTLLNLVYYSNMPQIMTFMLTIVLILVTVSCTVELTKSLYFSEDNKVLITLPVSNNKIFISKLLVFMLYEFKRGLSFTIPIVLGCMINIYLKSYLNGWSFLWMILPTILVLILPVVLGALLSIPSLYIYRFVAKYRITKYFVMFLGLAAYVLIVLSLTQFLPTNIDMVNQWGDVQKSVLGFLNKFETYNPAIKQLTRIFIGELHTFKINDIPVSKYIINEWTILKFVILFAIIAILFGLCFLISRPIFFNMMSKNFEFNKVNARAKVNKKHSKLLAFNLKEMKVTFRTYEISINYLLIYTSIPILVFILDQLFIAMDKNTFGVYLSYGFNILVIAFPLLVTNSTIATLYSKEGRTGYIKKTKPVNPLMPLLSKLSFNLILSIPCILSCVLIFNNYINVCIATDPERFVGASPLDPIFLFIGLLLLYYAHVFYCAKIDLTNPQNENYATSGNDFGNPNEHKAAIMGAIIAVIYSLFAFKLFSEGISTGASITIMCLKLMFISLGLFIYIIVTFILSVKLLYAPNKE